ncbi:unnamed protein product [Fraxinus pennsylvanica]|uniref:Tubby C-terminal domain-containing protein n=1 Tax=Fraxinus pennsylvanica TaxID=56036 RepID=A0AAD1Z207_9LAMI|nr:unnamed protein product [Fraxinus pennsylvanica]
MYGSCEHTKVTTSSALMVEEGVPVSKQWPIQICSNLAILEVLWVKGDMKGEFGSISRKGFDVKFGYGLRSRSHRVVQDISMTSTDALKQSCWANMPPELLRDVLMRIEESECTWPTRKNVVACAGVCRSWREIMKEIVKTLEVSSKLTFPISLKQPGPRNTLVQCFIKRERSNQTYRLYLNLNQASNDDGKFLLVARRCRRPTYTDYIISLNADNVSKGSSTYIGKLRSNFLGTKFIIYDSQPPNAGARVAKSRSTRLIQMRQVSPRVPAGNYPVAHISYELNVLGSRGPRRMQCVMDAIPASAVDPGGMDLVDKSSRMLFSNSGKWERMCSPWTISIQYLLSRRLPFVSAALIPKLPANDFRASLGGNMSYVNMISANFNSCLFFLY